MLFLVRGNWDGSLFETEGLKSHHTHLTALLCSQPAADTVKFEEEAKLPEPTRWRYYLRHPYARLSTSYLVTFCNFLIFAEDPVSHSYSECNISIIGDIYSFMCIKCVLVQSVLQS